MKPGILLAITAWMGLWSPGAEAETKILPKEEVKAKKIFPHTEVRLFLKNGDKIKGIVLKNRFYEKAAKSGFKATTKNDRSAGLRLWFSHDTDSYVFYPWKRIQRYEFLKGLTEVEVRQIKRRVEKLAWDQKEKRRLEEVAKREKEKSDKKNLKSKQDPKKKKKVEIDPKLAKSLLEKFSPDKGWGKDRLDKIKLNKINDIYPTKDEQEFLEVYSSWEKAIVWKQEEDKKVKKKGVKKEKESNSAGEKASDKK